MSNSKEEKSKSAGERMLENFLRGIPDEVREPDNDTPDLLEGTSREIAFIGEDGSICVNYFGQQDHVSGRGWEQIKPDEPMYAEYCAKYGLKKPGDSKLILRKFIDGQWVEVDQDQAESKSPSEM